MRPLTPQGLFCLSKFDGCVKKIHLDKESAMSNHCNKKKVSMGLVVFSFLFSEKYLHLIYFVYTKSLAISCLFCSSQELGCFNY